MTEVMKKLGWDVHPEDISFLDCIMDIAGDVNHDVYLSQEELAAPSYEPPHNTPLFLFIGHEFF